MKSVFPSLFSHHSPCSSSVMVAAHSHSNHPGHPQYSCTPSDLDLLRALSSTHTPVSASIPSTSAKSVTGKSRRAPVNVVTRRPQLDPLILETAASSGPQYVISQIRPCIDFAELTVSALNFALFDIHSASLVITFYTNSILTQKTPARHSLYQEPAKAGPPGLQHIHPAMLDQIAKMKSYNKLMQMHMHLYMLTQMNNIKVSKCRLALTIPCIHHGKLHAAYG